MCVTTKTVSVSSESESLPSFGATVATIAFSISHEYPAVLAIFGFLFSLPCFYYIVSSPQYATTGRFVLLTYNLTCLFW